MRTTCEYSPVHRTRRNSADSEGKAFAILGKYCISCLGGAEDIFGSFPSRVVDLENALFDEIVLRELNAVQWTVLASLYESMDGLKV